MPQRRRFVLVRPEYPSNMGAAARAVRTMGIDTLEFVAPQRDPLGERALALACSAAPLLAEAPRWGSVREAVVDAGLVIGTTMRSRQGWPEPQTPEAIAQQFPILAPTGDIIVLFGNESTGLSGEEIAQCDLLSRIPLAHTQPSLNLAQAVMLYGYLLRAPTNDTKPRKDSEPVVTPSIQVLRQRCATLLDRLGFGVEHGQRDYIMRRLAHACASKRDVAALHSVTQRLMQALDN